MSAVLTIALPVFAVMAVGALAGRAGWLGEADAQALNKFVFRFAMPAALFGLTAGATPPGAADAALAASYAIAAAVTLFGGYWLAQRLFPITKPEAGAHAFSSTLGNAVFLGLPIALSVGDWARPFVVLMLIEGIFVIAIGAALMRPRREAGSFLTRAAGLFAGPAKNPLVIGMAAGFAYSMTGFDFSGPVETFFSLLGRAAGPVALFSMGLFLATHPLSAFAEVRSRVAVIAAAKMIILPAIALGAARLFGVADPAYVGALALFSLVPSAVGSFVMASQYGVYVREAAAAVFVTTLLSLLTISGVLVVFGG